MRKITDLIARLVPALILGQTLFFKFSGAAESVYIFEKIGIEPWGRWTIGILELLAVLLLLWPRRAWIGALFAGLLMLGALGAHFTTLGIEVQGDGGLLFIYAWLVLLCCVFLVIRNRNHIQKVIRSKRTRK